MPPRNDPRSTFGEPDFDAPLLPGCDETLAAQCVHELPAKSMSDRRRSAERVLIDQHL